ncbi:hypothetical protein [Streptomyces avicenniae]|uniref:hypothetical protein n=1 Tax=Streptomyces avicenniae TaxID=500153 RepID=UPI00167EFEFB|nr:hypothetical protein [Streptomyces avicenniae]
MPDHTSPSWDWWNAQLPPESRAIDFVDHARAQIRDLLPYVTHDQRVEPPAVANACIESFLANVRLMADFLFKGHPEKDTRAVDLVSGWQLSPLLKERLEKWWLLASRHVMHLSRERTPEDLRDVQPVTRDEYRQMAMDCEEAYNAFRKAYQNKGSK